MGHIVSIINNFLGKLKQLEAFSGALKPFRADSGYIRATDVVPFSGFLLGSHVQQRTDDNAGNLLVLPLSEAVVIRTG